MKKKILNKQAFTLVELMIVIVIIGVMAAMVVPKLSGKGEQARRAAAKADIDANLSSAIDMYEVDTGRLPNKEDGLKALLEKPNDPKLAKRWKGPYIKKPPVDPWGNEYIYRLPSTHQMEYDLFSVGPDGSEGGGDDVANWDAEES